MLFRQDYIDNALIKIKGFVLDNLFRCSRHHRAFFDCSICGIDLGPQTIEGNQSAGGSSIYTSYSVSSYSYTSSLKGPLLTGHQSVLVPAIAQLAYFLPTTDSVDPTFDLWTSVLCTQITQSVNIITACFIQVKPFITSLHSGLLHNNDERRRIRQGSRSASNYVSLSAKGVTRSNRTGSDAKALTSQASNQFSGGRDPWDHYDEDTIEQVERQTPFYILPQKLMSSRSAKVSVLARSSSKPPTGSDIRQTTRITVEYSDRDES
jgi:hypothetical protein